MSMRIVLQLPEFGKIPLEQIAIEVGPITGLTYFVWKGRTVAIGAPSRRR